MIDHRARRVYDMRCQAEALERSGETVTVELSVPVAWVLRDLLGFGYKPRGLQDVPTNPDMLRLNAALWHRPPHPEGTLPKPDVSGWSSRIISEMKPRG